MEPDKIRAIIGGLIITGFLAVIAAFFVFPLKGDTGLFNVLIGILGGSFTAVVGFYFGSSSGSKAKDTTLSSIAMPAVPEVVKPVAGPRPVSA